MPLKNRYLIIFLMVLFPTLHTVPRAIHIIVSVLIVILLLNNRLVFNQNIILYTIGTVLLSLFAILNGIIQGNDVIGAIPMYILWPLVFLFFVGYKTNKIDLLRYETTIILSSLLGCVLVTSGVINILMQGKSYFFSEIYPVELGFVNGLPKFGSQFLPVLCFTIPFVFFSSVSTKKLKRFVYIACFIFMLTFALIAGRSVFILVCILIIFMSIPYSILIKNKRKNLFFTNLLLFLFICFIFLNFSNESTKIINIFIDKTLSNENEVLNSSRRYEQFTNIIDRIQNSPVFGFGLNAPETINSKVVSFELTYLQLLLNFGFIGFSTLVVLNFFFIFRVVSFFRKCQKIEIVAPWLFGYFSYMVCSATNPILLKFDRIWIICIPILLFCHRKRLVY